MEQLTISLTKWLSIDDECVVFEFGVNFTFFDTEFSWLFIFCFNATLASGGFGFKATLFQEVLASMLLWLQEVLLILSC